MCEGELCMFSECVRACVEREIFEREREKRACCCCCFCINISWLIGCGCGFGRVCVLGECAWWVRSGKWSCNGKRWLVPVGKL